MKFLIGITSLLLYLPIVAPLNITSYEDKADDPPIEEVLDKLSDELRRELAEHVNEVQFKSDDDSANVESNEQDEVEDANVTTTDEPVISRYEYFGKTPPLVQTYDKLIAKFIRLIEKYIHLMERYSALIRRKRGAADNLASEMNLGLQEYYSHKKLVDENFKMVDEMDKLVADNITFEDQRVIREDQHRLIDENVRLLNEASVPLERVQEMIERKTNLNVEIIDLAKPVLYMSMKCYRLLTEVRELNADKKKLPISF